MEYLVIPAYEPDFKLIKLLDKISQKSDFHVIVIDDGSGPAYRDIFRRAASYAIVLTHDLNQGKGQALKTAFDYLQKQEPGIVVTADSDGQHKVWDILRVKNAASASPSHLVLGSRAFTGNVPFRSRFGNYLTKKLFQIQTGLGISDTQTGLRAFHTDFLDDFLKIEGKRYEYEMNMLIYASKNEVIVEEVPIETVYINDNEGSHFRPVTDGLQIYGQLFKFALSSLSSFVVDYLVYAVSLLFLSAVPSALRILLANSIARVTSSSFNYASNKYLVFQNKESAVKTGSSYVGLALVLFLLDTFLIQLLHASLGINLYLVKIVVGFLLFFFSWFIQKKVIFKSTPASQE